MKTRKHSLARNLLQGLLPLTVLILVSGGGVAYYVAHKAATVAYDRALMASALAIAALVDTENGHLHLKLSKVANEILLTDTYDQIFYEVVDGNGKSIAGDIGLPLPPQPFENENPYYDGSYHGKPVRVAALLHEYHGMPFTVLSSETKLKRDRLVSDILFAMLVPELLLITVAILMINRTVRRGLASIQPLREELIRRTHTDLSQLPLTNIPEEIYPIFAEVNELLARLSAALDAKKHFVADASHQLRTPIAALQAQAELALRSSDPREHLENIVAGTRRITHLAHQLLTLSRLEPQQIITPKIVDLAELTRDVAERWMLLAMQRNVDLGFELSPAKVMGDPVWLEELANNLIDNALRYMPSGGIATVRCSSSASRISWEFEDSGPGIPAAERERVFERFYRLGSTGVDGCGLGLAIVREIAHSHNASIAIEQGKNLGGALIRVTFPAIPVQG
ncbi:MAG: sensor histidine kinase [Gallionella sp.]